MSDHSDLIAELRALADCDSRAGEPLGKCMRRAADKIERLAEHVDYIEAQWLAKDAALSSQSLSLSEAREEIERLKGLVAGIRECPQETITGVALLYDDGRIIALPRPHRHHHLYAFAAFIGQQPDEHESGFTTSTGRYVDREEAQRICVAAGQPNRRSGSQHDPKLYSEDVW